MVGETYIPHDRKAEFSAKAAFHFVFTPFVYTDFANSVRDVESTNIMMDKATRHNVIIKRKLFLPRQSITRVQGKPLKCRVKSKSYSVKLRKTDIAKSG